MARVTGTLIAAACTVALTGCVSMASSGPVLPYKITQGNANSGQQYLQVTSAPPAIGADPLAIVRGFLDANATFADNHKVAREYLTSKAASTWSPPLADVLAHDPVVRLISGGGTDARTAQVEVSGKVQSSVTSGEGDYPAPTPAHGQWQQTLTLERPPGGQWRIAKPPTTLLLSAVDFSADYQSRNLYFFNPSMSALVPDPVYVPLEAARADPNTLLYGLVKDLTPISLPQDLLARGPTQTAFPAGSKILGVNLADGAANVNLGGTLASAKDDVLEQVSAQLLWTLIGSGSSPAVQSVEVYLNGKPWSPPGAGNFPVQQLQDGQYSPATGNYKHMRLYYLAADGNVMSRASPTGRATMVYTPPHGHPRLTAIAVSPDQKYLAGLSGGTVYVGALGGPLRNRESAGFTSMSWDTSDQLWVSSPTGIELLHAAGGMAQMVPYVPQVPSTSSITALRVAPDGVRVAMVLNGSQVAFGAILEGQSVRSSQVSIVSSRFSVQGTRITGLSWYGPDDVIVLSGEGLTEYPVNGSASMPLVRPLGMVNVTASWGSPLIASQSDGQMSYNPSVNGGWQQIGGTGSAAVYPG